MRAAPATRLHSITSNSFRNRAEPSALEVDIQARDKPAIQKRLPDFFTRLTKGAIEITAKIIMISPDKAAIRMRAREEAAPNRPQCGGCSGKDAVPEEAEHVGVIDSSNTFPPLQLRDLLVKALHLCPLAFRPEVMLRVVPVVEKNQL